MRQDCVEMVVLARETLALSGVAYVLGIVILATAGLLDGPLAGPSLVLVLAGLVVVGAAFGRRIGARPPHFVRARLPLLVLIAALGVFCISTFADRRLLIDAEGTPRAIHVVALAELALLLTYAAPIVRGTPERASWANIRFALFAALFLVGAASVVSASPHPHIDVWAVHTEGAKALLQGQNPYTAVHVEDSSWLHMPPVAFDYPPTPCYMSVIAYVLGRDVRWGGIAALLASGIATRLLARRALGESRAASPAPALLADAPTLLIWLSPKVFFILEQAWNDTYPLAFAALALAAHAREKRYLSAVLLGLALSAKQTMVWFLPLAFLLRFGAGHWAAFLGTAGATFIPFALWDFFALKYWLLDYFVGYPLRPESLTPQNWLYRHFGFTPSSLPGFISAATVAALVLWKGPRSRAMFALAATLTFGCFYVFNRFMFVNYYFFVSALACVAAATSLELTSTDG